MIYLAGPIDKKSYMWRNKITKLLSPITVFNPEKLEVQRTPSSIVNTDLNFIHQSKLVIVYLSKLSAGTSMEMVYAHFYRKPIILVCPKANEKLLSPWHIYHSTYVLSTIKEAVKMIKEGYFKDLL